MQRVGAKEIAAIVFVAPERHGSRCRPGASPPPDLSSIHAGLRPFSPQPLSAAVTRVRSCDSSFLRSSPTSADTCLPLLQPLCALARLSRLRVGRRFRLFCLNSRQPLLLGFAGLALCFRFGNRRLTLNLQLFDNAFRCRVALRFFRLCLSSQQPRDGLRLLLEAATLRRSCASPPPRHPASLLPPLP